jgi:hypothetical protein
VAWSLASPACRDAWGRTAPVDTRVDFAVVVNESGAAIEVGVNAPQALLAAIADARRL